MPDTAPQGQLSTRAVCTRDRAPLSQLAGVSSRFETAQRLVGATCTCIIWSSCSKVFVAVHHDSTWQRAADLPTGLLKEVECSGVDTVAKAQEGTASPRPAASMSSLRTVMNPCLRPILSGCVCTGGTEGRVGVSTAHMPGSADGKHSLVSCDLQAEDATLVLGEATCTSSNACTRPQGCKTNQMRVAIGIFDPALPSGWSTKFARSSVCDSAVGGPARWHWADHWCAAIGRGPARGCFTCVYWCPEAGSSAFWSRTLE